ncbi:hypothetical protein GCM10025867_36780 [Frondihabitans sucicola]|uniref:Uncharacterized protein n=1 Tax=Frondihabitans sucicola TaxID=1268041 RepID=A0ABM8GSZ2_9MICO|nr:hypothetical protein GCM10025867_36780 [Frondihabitans sucicola]
MHEHVFTLNAEIRDEYPWDEDAVVAQAVGELDELKASGIDTILDLTVFGLGRNIRRIKRIAEKTSLRIIAATGIYTYRDLPTFFSSTKRAHRASSNDSSPERSRRGSTTPASGRPP